MRLHHVQVCCPPGGEDAARHFYGDALGLTEVPKPRELAGRGGAWFRAYDGERVVAEIHVGVEEPFTAARRAHPALELDSPDALHAVEERLRQAGYEADAEQRWTFAGFERVHAADPHGNRVELLAPHHD